MGKFKIVITSSAEKALFKVSRQILPKILSCINGLSFDPFPRGYKKIKGHDNTFRLRVQNYRIIYELQADVLTIKVLKVGHRKDIYRNL